MTANTTPIFPRLPDVQIGGAVIGNTANTAMDGSGTCYPIFQADAVNGSSLIAVRLKPISGTISATVARLFICTVTGAFTPGTTNTAANSSLWDEISLPALTASNSLAQNAFQIPPPPVLAPGFRLFLTFGTSTGAAGIGYHATVIAGPY